MLDSFKLLLFSRRWSGEEVGFLSCQRCFVGSSRLDRPNLQEGLRVESSLMPLEAEARRTVVMIEVDILTALYPFDNFDGLLGTKQRMSTYICF